MCLYANRDLLGSMGLDVAYPGRDGVPGGRLKLRLPGPRHGPRRLGPFAQAAHEVLAQASPDETRGLLVSEENLPGRMFHFYEGQFFPASRKRLSVFRQAIGAAELHVIYVLRAYDELYTSAYRKRAEDNAVVGFDALVPQFLNMDRGWPELVAEMRDILGPARFTVLPYERRGQSRELLTKLLPDLPLSAVEPDRLLNLSATDAALEALQSHYHKGETLERADWQEIVRTHADDRASRGFAEFSEADRRSLKDRYQADLDRVAGLEGITFL